MKRPLTLFEIEGNARRAKQNATTRYKRMVARAMEKLVQEKQEDNKMNGVRE